MVSRKDFLRGTVAAVPTALFACTQAEAQSTAETVSILQFLSVDAADDCCVADAIEAALDAADVVTFPHREYRIGRTVVVPPAKVLLGLSGPLPRSRGIGKGPVFVAWGSEDSPSPDVLFHAKNSVRFVNLAFRGPDPEEKLGIAVLMQHDSSPIEDAEDTDGEFHGCIFSFFDVAVEHHNRGLLFSNNIIELCRDGVKLNWDFDFSQDFNEDLDNDQLPVGFRAIRILGNRFHGNGHFINNADGPDEDSPVRRFLRGLQCCNNLLDIGGVLFVGQLLSGHFEGNTVDYFESKTAPITIRSSVDFLVISGNSFNGKPSARPPCCIEFEHPVQNLTLSGNAFRGVREAAVLFLGEVRSSTISGNTFSECGTDDGNAVCLRFSAELRESTIVGNSFLGRKHVQPTNAFLECARAVSELSVMGNVFRGARRWGLYFGGEVSNGTVTGNTFSLVGTAGENRACIKFVDEVNETVITSNSFRPEEDTDCVRGQQHVDWRGVIVQHNVAPSSARMVLYTGQDTSNDLQS